MKETKRISKLFEDLYNGGPWIDVTITTTVERLTAKQAAQKPPAGINSIWQILNHLISWRKNVLQRVKGKVISTPDHNYILPVSDTSAKAWANTLKKLEKSQQEWLEFLEQIKTNDLLKTYPKNQMTYYDHIQGILQHDAYHLGQIVILSKWIRSVKE
ncbi:MAG TPA: DinB family protein [Chitinophagaceae bacterium]|nr:DinB family protein [Chitinophagaceae bacterium]HRX92851.1 DinB family protein [Chitinophagaceae bacterium]